MKNVEVFRQLQRLKSLIQKAVVSTPDVELQSHWAQHFCVLASGVLENALKEIYSEYVRRAASPAVSSYARSRLVQIQNPKSTVFVETTRCFDPTWAAKLEAFLQQEGRKDAIDSIMANRHQIAHGQNSGITVVRISEYLRKSEAVLDFIENQVRGEK